MNYYTYRVIIEPDKNNTFHAHAPALIGCHTWGKSLAEARANIRDAIDVYIRSLIADGESVPKEQGIEIVESFTLPLSSTSKKSMTYA